ncbi:PIG-L family deacetylase [Candidatus Woesearchaeota archaeon]|nr:PIG-L family deacetylase [Candidatus Woesearchaeota archaeon]
MKKKPNAPAEPEKKAILVFCAHSDDQVFGPGGTMAKYAAKGYDVINVVFSYGELSHPWIKRRVTAEIRQEEAKEADKIIGGKEVLFLGISEAKFAKEAESEWVMEKLAQMIRHYKPIKIFTHSIDDMHPAHRAVHKTVMAVLGSMNYRCDAYAFDVWNPLNFRGRSEPKMYVDITDTFKLKLKALRCFRSQWMTMIFLLWTVHFRAIINGLDARCKYAERFYKIR